MKKGAHTAIIPAILPFQSYLQENIAQYMKSVTSLFVSSRFSQWCYLLCNHILQGQLALNCFVQRSHAWTVGITILVCQAP